MTKVEIRGDQLVVTMRGLSKFFAFKDKITVPLANVTGATTNTKAMPGVFKALRIPGTHLPAVIAAGTYYIEKRRYFWDVKFWEQPVRIDLQDSHYDVLVVGVDDPAQIVAEIEDAIAVD